MPVQTNGFHMNDINTNFKPKSVGKKKGERNRQNRAVSKYTDCHNSGNGGGDIVLTERLAENLIQLLEKVSWYNQKTCGHSAWQPSASYSCLAVGSQSVPFLSKREINSLNVECAQRRGAGREQGI